MAAGKTTYLRNLVINATLRGQSFTPPPAHYVALHYADPTENGNQGELSGNGYARQAASFNAPTNGEVANSAEIIFPQATANWLVVTHFSIWDAASGGNCLYQAPLSAPVQIESGDNAKIPAGALVVAEK